MTMQKKVSGVSCEPPSAPTDGAREGRWVDGRAGGRAWRLAVSYFRVVVDQVWRLESLSTINTDEHQSW